MTRIDEVPAAYQRFYFANPGGPRRKVVSREAVGKDWQLLTLECGDRVLVPRYQRAAHCACGFCGGLEPLVEAGPWVVPFRKDEG